MKTTVEIQDALLKTARKLAAEEETTVRALIEEGLRRVIEQRETSQRFRLREASSGEGGLNPDVREGSWERIRDLVYEGRGT
ncbi:MAG TPA: type II toxin-antitoxin system VapB family antitoxin [Vicinamibacteria bacterium]|nr:type II toxin-antitoxin system VapB family antitoxin [Vicinamibacteria bacterium]